MPKSSSDWVVLPQTTLRRYAPVLQNLQSFIRKRRQHFLGLLQTSSKAASLATRMSYVILQCLTPVVGARTSAPSLRRRTSERTTPTKQTGRKDPIDYVKIHQ